jgi:hypothetical protein
METTDRRRHKREYITQAMECVLNDHSSQKEKFDCIVADISESGVCLIAADPLEHGQEIKMINHIFPSPRTAVVRWIMEHYGLYYRAGLEFN